jgi:hypothetical protein
MPGTCKSISISAATYAKLRAWCDLHDVTMSSVIEGEVNKYIDAQPENLLDEPVRVAGGEP